MPTVNRTFLFAWSGVPYKVKQTLYWRMKKKFRQRALRLRLFLHRGIQVALVAIGLRMRKSALAETRYFTEAVADATFLPEV